MLYADKSSVIVIGGIIGGVTSGVGLDLELTLVILVIVQLGFNLSNGVTDTLQSSSKLIYFSKHMGL
jgi:hypothetical protein